MGKVQVGCPFKVFGTENDSCQVELDTFIGDASYIGRDRTCTDTGRNRGRLVVQQVFGDTAEVFYSTIQTAAEQFEIESGIEGIGGFPCQVFVAFIGEGSGVLTVAV